MYMYMFGIHTPIASWLCTVYTPPSHGCTEQVPCKASSLILPCNYHQQLGGKPHGCQFRAQRGDSQSSFDGPDSHGFWCTYAQRGTTHGTLAI